MKKYLFLTIILLTVCILTIPSLSVFAQTYISVPLDNPLKNTSLYCFLKDILGAFLNLLIVLAIFYIIYSGFMMVSARGNETKLKEAKQSFTYAVIGTAVLLGAWTLAKIIQATVEKVTVSGTVTITTTCP